MKFKERKMARDDIFISEADSIKDALKKLDKNEEKVLLVIKDNKLLGTITDGDIRRYVLRGNSLELNVKELYNKNPTYINEDKFSIEQSREIMRKNRITLLPIVDNENRVLDYITRDKVLHGEEALPFHSTSLDVPVVIMSGGKGTRLEPFSKIFPKALIPIGDKPIIQFIIDEFRRYGITQYYLILNHKGEMIKSYFENTEKDYSINYIWEKDFFGTAGSLRLLEDKIVDVFLVSNCDVIVKANFEEVVNFHIENKASVTTVCAIQHHKLPYGIVQFKAGGEIVEIIEKPEYTFTVNAGVYVLSREALKFIPDKGRFDMTDLIRNLLKEGKKVLMYPVNESDYIDIGQWEEYKKVLGKL